MKKEDFVIIAGMPRAGTTYMYQMLRKHPHFFLPPVKETNYFLYNYKRGMEWFEDLYQSAENGSKIFDISPFYFLDKEALKRIKSFNSDQKLILILREPNSWVKSFYKQVKSQSYGLSDFSNFINRYEVKFEGFKMTLELQKFDFKKRIEEFRILFGENLLLVDFDAFSKNKLTILKEIENFVEVEPFFTEKNIIQEKVNAGKRDNNKFITYLSTISILRTIAFNFLPEKIIHFIRNKYILGEAINDYKEEQLPDIYHKDYNFQDLFEGTHGVIRG